MFGDGGMAEIQKIYIRKMFGGRGIILKIPILQ